MQICEIFRAKVVDVTKRSVVVEVTGTCDKVDAFEALVRPFGLIEMARTGEIAHLPRPERDLEVTSARRTRAQVAAAIGDDRDHRAVALREWLNSPAYWRGVAQAEHNAEVWRQGSYGDEYDNRMLQPAEVLLLARYREAFSGRVLERRLRRRPPARLPGGAGGEAHGDRHLGRRWWRPAGAGSPASRCEVGELADAGDEHRGAVRR